MPIESLILLFQKFLLASWPQLALIMNDHDWDDDPYFIDYWIQANWELLVEHQLLDDVILPAYGYDVDPNARYKKKGSAPTHYIACKPNSTKDALVFVCFAAKNGCDISLAPPFDIVRVRCEKTLELSYMPLESVKFFLVKFA
ncbi:hypothetical protein ABMC88_18455 [Sulfitobacter sp. HNIBRBA2951]|uniref:hypothetical protein n=1 Tax=Sulfitobacter aquimarinus TaxID=3158557 RepID=UPI0032DE61BD